MKINKHLLTGFNFEETFNNILTKIENGMVKTTHQLRLMLDDSAEEFNVKTLSLLVTFREWLLHKNIELSTDNGVVEISKAVD